MKLTIEKLDEKHLPMVDAFTCVESKEQLQNLKADKRKRIIKHSKEMDDFLREEALAEQTKNQNVTYLFIDKANKQIAGYISLCNDCISLETTEKDALQLTYRTIPAIKIARLAVNNTYKRNGLGKQLIAFAAYVASKIRTYSGLVFVTLDCYDHRLSYYTSMGFVRNVIQPIQLQYDSPNSMRILLETLIENISDNNS